MYPVPQSGSRHEAGDTGYVMSDSLIFKVGGIAGHPGQKRDFSGAQRIHAEVLDSVMDDEMTVTGTFTGTVDGVEADYTVTASIDLVCTRCLTEWSTLLEAKGNRHFSRIPDEDGYAIIEGTVDMSGPATDELVLSIPLAPVCRPDCKGLCPICGTDLNTDPCDGHGDDSDSPFAPLKDLFDS